MDQLPALGTEIQQQVMPTLEIYGKLLARNADAIKKTKKETHTYGPHPRHELDVYYPTKASKPADGDEEENGAADLDDPPVLIFVHGGGLVFGDRMIETKPTPDLVYANLGHYFAEECGYITVIPSYRLVYKHDAKFPTGGEDVALAVKWVKGNLALESRARNLFLMGHSAGGVHVATYLLAQQCEADVGTVTGNLKRQPVKLRGAILLSVPYHFQGAHDRRMDVLKTYYADRMEQDSPLGLLKAFQERNPKEFPLAGVQVLVVDTTLDSEPEIRGPNTEFLGQWLKSENQEMKNHILYREIEGHNHVSTSYALGTGVEKEEAWGEEVSGFVESIRRRDQVQKDLQILRDSIRQAPSMTSGAEGTSKPE